MRNAFATEITKLAEKDERIVLLAGDIGNRLFNRFQETCSERFFNCGVAEANMIGVAAGMAMNGLRPFAYTIVPFLTTRCLEQIRVDLAYHHQPVVLVGVGGGLSYATLGGTHHSCEDIGFLRLIPGMAVLCPGDAMEVRGAVHAALSHDGPVYIRLGKKGEPVLHNQVPKVRIGKSIRLRDGGDVALLSVGNMLPLACEVADLLEAQNVSVRVESFISVKPLDEKTLDEVFRQCRVVGVIEEHSVLGGCGSAVGEWLHAQCDGSYASDYQARLVSIGTADAFVHEAGSQEHMRRWYGLTADGIVKKILTALHSVSGQSEVRV